MGEPFLLHTFAKLRQLLFLDGVFVITPYIEFQFLFQFLQLSTILPSSSIYGLGEWRQDLMLDLNWRHVTIWTVDHWPLVINNGFKASVCNEIAIFYTYQKKLFTDNHSNIL